MRVIRDLAYGPLPENRLDLYLPRQECFDLFLYFHGGGLEAGDKANDALIFEHLAARGIAAASVNYRMYPSARYPDFVEDSALAAAWVKAHIGEYGRCGRIFIGGSSAGGYLSMMLCFDARWLGRHGLKATDFAGFVHDAGQPTRHYNVLREAGIDGRRVIVDDTSPLYHVGEDAAYPPMLLIVSDQDMTNRYEQTQLLLSTLRHFGCGEERARLQVMHGGHCHYVGKRDEQGASVLGRMVEEFIGGV